ncbi:MAG: phosphoenolpyruvate carboxykinase (ATP), partial [Nitrosopumilaceae archaeon]
MSEKSGSSITSKFTSQLVEFGINPSAVHRNLPVTKLVEISVQKNEGIVTTTGSISVKTGKYTGRSPDDRYIIYDDETHENVDWGKINHQFPTGKFDKIFEKMKNFVNGKEIY